MKYSTPTVLFAMAMAATVSAQSTVPASVSSMLAANGTSIFPYPTGTAGNAQTVTVISNYSLPASEASFTLVYTTVLNAFCSTGIAPITYTITSSCSQPISTPDASVVPQGFVVTTTACSICGPSAITTVLTVCTACPASASVVAAPAAIYRNMTTSSTGAAATFAPLFTLNPTTITTATLSSVAVASSSTVALPVAPVVAPKVQASANSTITPFIGAASSVSVGFKLCGALAFAGLTCIYWL